MEIKSPAPSVNLDVVRYFCIESELPCFACCLGAYFFSYELKSEKSNRPFSVEESQFTCIGYKIRFGPLRWRRRSYRNLHPFWLWSCPR